MPFGDGAALKLASTQHLAIDRCPHCTVASPVMLRVSDFDAAPRRPGSLPANAKYHWHVYACQSCGGVVCGAVAFLADGRPLGGDGSLRWIIPAPAVGRADLPPRVAAFLDQAAETLNSPTASVVVSASAVDAMLKARGLKEGSLYKRIDEAVNSHLITKDMGDWAHDIRLDANDGRHADENAPLHTVEDAQRCYDFAEALSEVLFILPARVKRGREGKGVPVQ